MFSFLFFLLFFLFFLLLFYYYFVLVYVHTARSKAGSGTGGGGWGRKVLCVFTQKKLDRVIPTAGVLCWRGVVVVVGKETNVDDAYRWAGASSAPPRALRLPAFMLSCWPELGCVVCSSDPGGGVG